MLRLPEKGEEAPPLVLKLDKERRPTNRHRQEKIFDETFADKTGPSPLLIKNVVAVVIAAAVTLAVGLLWPSGESEAASAVPDAAGTPGEGAGGPGSDPSPQAAVAEESGPAAEDEPLTAIMVRRELVPVVRAFMEAGSVEEMLGHVRHPERTRPRVEEFHAGRTFEAPGFRALDWGSPMIRRGKWARVYAEADDFLRRTLWLAEEDGEWRIDWESWAGWSSRSWPEIREQQPEGSFELRVLVNDVEYYNFDFADESAWSSFSLSGPRDGDLSLYGYAEAGGEADFALRLHEGSRDRRFRLRVRFPDDPATDNQLLIEEVLSDDWLDAEDPS